MKNSGVKCNVEECVHHCGVDDCSLPNIMVTHEKTGENSVSIPHFCKSYDKK